MYSHHPMGRSACIGAEPGTATSSSRGRALKSLATLITLCLATAGIAQGGIFSTPGTTSTFAGTTRNYEVSSQSDLATTSYQIEVTVTVNNGSGLGSAFLGIGPGTKNAAFYDEPKDALFLLLGPSNFGLSILSTTINSVEQNRVVGPGNGTHRLRLTWDADNRRALIEIDEDWGGGPGAVFNPDFQFPLCAPQLAVNSSTRFFCGGALGVSFSDYTIQQPLLGQNTTRTFPGTLNTDRAYLVSGQADLEAQSYEAEVTLTVNGGGGLGAAFFGIGQGQPNPAFYYEPKDSLSVLIGPSNFANGVVEAQVNGVIATNALNSQVARVNGPGNGTHRVRIIWDADNRRALVEVHPNWVTGATFTPTLQFLIKAPELDVTSKSRFFCGGAGGVTFTNFSAKPLLGPYATVFGPAPLTTQRSYLVSAQTDLANQSYRAEVTMTMSGMGPHGTAFIGVGDGKPNATFYDTPTTAPSAGFTISPPDFDAGQITAWLDSTKLSFPIGWAEMGTHRLRLRWDATNKIALLDIHKNWHPGDTFVATLSRRISIDASGKTLTKNQRFFCGGAAGVTFADFSAIAIPAQDAFAGDPTAGSWLPAGLAAKPAGDVTAADSLLTTLGGKSRLLSSWYNDTSLKASRAFSNSPAPNGSTGTLATSSSVWENTITATNILNGSVVEGQDLTVRFKLNAGAAITSSVAMAFDFPNWDPANYVFAPAMLYNGNRFRVLPMSYPPFLNEPDAWPLGNMPITVANILHLGSTKTLVEMLTWNLATPMVGFYDRTRHRGFLILTEPKTKYGVSGIMVEEDPANGKLSLVVSAPGVRKERYTGQGVERRGSTADLGVDLYPGDEVTMKLKVYNFPAANIPEFFAKAFDIRKAISGQNTFRNVTPFSAAANLITAQHDALKWYEPGGPSGAYGYFSANGSEGTHQVGWCGNPVFGLPQAILSTTERLRRVRRTLDMLPHAQASTGLFYAMFVNGTLLGDTFGDASSPLNKSVSPYREVSMVRRNGEVLNFGLEQIRVLEAKGSPITPAWKTMLQNCANGLVTLYGTYGQFGQFVNVSNGVMFTNGSTAGATCIGALARASVYFNNTTYLNTAKAAGDMYYARDLSQGYTGGAPGEILQCPDMEAAWALADSYMALYEITGDTKWRNYARDAINMLASFTVSYDYEFPANSALGRAGVNATGSVFASPQNNHSSPGIYVGSGDFLLKYFRSTQDPRYAELYKDMNHNLIQYLNTPSNRIQHTNTDPFVSERVQLSDWEGGNMGQVSDPDSNQAWECLVQLVSLQNPGIYYNTTSDYLIVLDHVKTERVSKDGAGTRLKLTNTTPYNAEVKVLAETGSQAQIPLGHTAYLDWPKVAVAAGQTRYILISPSGSVSEYTP